MSILPEIEMANKNRKLLLTLSTLVHFKYFSSLIILGTFLTCSKPSPIEPEEKRPQIEVTGDITEEPVWESGMDYVY